MSESTSTTSGTSGGDTVIDPPDYKAVFEGTYQAAKVAIRARRLAEKEATRVKADAEEANRVEQQDATQALQAARSAVDLAFAEEQAAIDEAKKQADLAAKKAYDATIEAAVEAATS